LSVCGTNAFKIVNSNSSLNAKSCSCAYIEFLAAIFPAWWTEIKEIKAGLDLKVGWGRQEIYTEFMWKMFLGSCPLELRA
jgi:hypothetical protein